MRLKALIEHSSKGKAKKIWPWEHIKKKIRQFLREKTTTNPRNFVVFDL